MKICLITALSLVAVSCAKVDSQKSGSDASNTDAIPGDSDGAIDGPPMIDAPPDALVCGDIQLLQNGNFDQGPTAAWVETSQYQIIMDQANLPSSLTPHSGQYLAWLGGAVSSVDSLEQVITIPADSQRLTISGHAYIASEDSTILDYDYLEVTLKDQNGANVETVASLDNTHQDTSWFSIGINTSANYAGQNMTLHLESTTDLSLNTNFWVDSLSIISHNCP